MQLDLSPLGISLKTALLATCFTFFLGITAAYWMLGYQGKWKSLIEGLFISPLILPPTVIGFLLLLLFGKNGFFGKVLLSLNVSVVFTWYAAVITATVVAFPLMYKTALGAFTQIDVNLLYAARTLGASEATIFWRIILPLAMPGIIAGITLSFARALGEFGATLMLAGNIPGQTQTMPMAIYFAVEAGSMNEAGAWVLLIMIISLSAITGINLWGTREGRSELVNYELPIESPKEVPLTTHQLPLSNAGLFVDISSSLPNFLLDVSFSTNKQVLGLLGASGAGKSMILRCIAGIETPTNGYIILNGQVLFDSVRGINVSSRNRRIGFLFQNYALFPHLTVAQNIAFGLPKSRSVLTIKQQVETQLLAVQLQEYANRYPHELSGGQQQRVALARALASQPEALLLDEPFSALDTHLRSQLEQQLIASVETYQGSTLFVTHNLEEAYRVCQDLLVLERGKAIAYSSKQDIFERPNTVSVAQLTGCKNFSRAIIKSSQQVKAIDWNCTLQVIEPVSELIAYVGIRAHQLTFTNNANQENTFPCWLVKTSETPHRMTLYLKLNSCPLNLQDYHLQAEVFKEKWESFKDQHLPWYVQLDPLRLILME